MKTTPITVERLEGTPIDWREIQRRLEAARQGLAQGAAPTAAERRSVLKARARALAQEPERTDAAQGALDIVEFRLASETYGVESAFVREVYSLKNITPLPGTPSFVLGVVNVRGQVLSVVDLKRFLNLPNIGLGDLNKIIVLRNDRLEFGILADAVLGARPISLAGAQTSLPTVFGVGADYLKGVTAEGVIVLDAEKILGDEKVIVCQEAEDSAVQQQRRNRS